MPWQSPRKLLVTCAGLDLAAVCLAVSCSNLHREPNLLHPPLVIGWVGLLYCTWAWLFGGYTLLRWPWLRLRLVGQRLLLTASATWASLVLVCWVLGVSVADVSLMRRDVLLEVLAWQTLFALLVRLLLRLVIRSRPKARWQLLASPDRGHNIIREWERNPFVRTPQLISTDWLTAPRKRSGSASPTTGLAVASELQLDLDQRSLISQLKSQGMVVTTLEDLAQRQLERIPPSLLPNTWLNFSDLPWSHELSLQRKAKRMADVTMAIVLLLVTAPVLVLIGAAIWIEDRGPILYVQQRTGWMGQSFRLFKLRTMRVARPGSTTRWTTNGDSRITGIGTILRRTRLDELPQLINVIRGEMSLIGPRPEQPFLDDELAAAIPHYRKRYWMLPGLSGWAQVCGPAYPASLEESELKLSYDLFYLRNWSLGLDLLILAKTIKTLLKVRGV